ESELFGHEKGSFTDAKTEKKGIFELASGGAILLDEIGEMKLNLQTKLLRVLEERRFRRVGGRNDIPINAAVFATTNKDLKDAMMRGEFRVDLYFRLNTFSLHIPPLRERKEDILPLAQHFLEMYSGQYCTSTFSCFTSDTEELLLSYGWPGNVRELRNVIERIVVLESGKTVLPSHLPKEILFQNGFGDMHASGTGFTLPDSGVSLDGVEKDFILQALRKSGNNKTQAAKLLGISYGSLRYQMKKFELE
ncbi:MAG TPA: sigma 54-interacting transcriptional regulator, partial [Candidatus Krumholzibacterium sp.]|nr:sigma 54-interacting transcriptional regulator [Candidatus Krumholzibacterium sp.]